MAAPAAAAAVWKAAKTRWDTTDLVGKAVTFVVVFLVFAYFAMSALMGAVVGTLAEPGTPAGYDPSGVAVADIPADYLQYYQAAGEAEGVDWAVLAAIGSIETDHGRSTLPGVQSGTNSYGCCAGPVQFCVLDGCPASGPRPLTVSEAQHGTWAQYGTDGNNDGQKDPWDPADAIPAEAKYLKANGAPGDYYRAIFAYNHAAWYVAQVQAKAAEYRGALAEGGVSGDVRQKVLSLAEKTMSIHTGYSRYTQGGPTTDDPTPPPPDRTDCSQWVRAIYLEAGLPDPGINTTDQIASGHRTDHPKAGDLMFSADGGHVEIYIGGGRTIGHGSPPIDYGTVDYYPGHFFEEYGLG